MSDDHIEEEPLIVCNLEEELSIDKLHTVKAALSGAGFVLEENLSKGRIEIYRPGPDDTIEPVDEYRDRITEEIKEEVEAAIASFKKKLERLADQTEAHSEGLTEQEQDLIELSRNTDSIPDDEAREQIGLAQDKEDTTNESDTEPADESTDSDAKDEEPDKKYTCGSCGGKFDAPVKASPKYHDCPEAESVCD